MSVLLTLGIALTLPGSVVTGTVATSFASRPPDRGAAMPSPPAGSLAPATTPPSSGPALSIDERRDLDRRITELGREVEFGIAVQDLRTGIAYGHDAERALPTASVAKLTILTMLYMCVEEEGGGLTSDELSRAERMIRHSDNEVTDGLYTRMGYIEGFERYAAELGFTATEPHPSGSWGSTMSTPADQLRLLRVLYSGEGPITDDSRSHVLDLMETVAPEQAWGVSVVAGPEDTVGLKNGWTPRPSDGDRWALGTVGYVVGPDREYLVAVLSRGHADYASGVETVEDLITEVIETIEGSGERGRTSAGDTFAR
ncbi:serine hydrolase [Nocardiopsis alba]|uniref:serine hydrolase n=1 Tax=Nocardiopsis alba TaxID=53437 RepID=UPI0034115823